MQGIQKMSGSEHEVMQALWRCGGRAPSAAIRQALNDQRSWKLSTVLTFLARLEKKGLVRSEKQGRGKAGIYTALVTEQDYKHLETRAFLDEVHRGSVASLMASLCGEERLDSRELEELQTWFDRLPNREGQADGTQPADRG